jgi:hypothetical protein
VTVRRDRTQVTITNMSASIEQAYTEAVQHLLTELGALADGVKAQRFDNTPTTGGTSDLTPTERAADARWTIMAELETLRDDQETARQVLSSQVHNIQRILRHRAPKAVDDRPLCDGTGLEGWDVTYVEHSRDPGNGWRKTNCVELAEANGLCATCGRRERRWRTSHGFEARPTSTEVAA